MIFTVWQLNFNKTVTRKRSWRCLSTLKAGRDHSEVSQTSKIRPCLQRQKKKQNRWWRSLTPCICSVLPPHREWKQDKGNRPSLSSAPSLSIPKHLELSCQVTPEYPRGKADSAGRGQLRLLITHKLSALKGTLMLAAVATFISLDTNSASWLRAVWRAVDSTFAALNHGTQGQMKLRITDLDSVLCPSGIWLNPGLLLPDSKTNGTG